MTSITAFNDNKEEGFFTKVGNGINNLSDKTINKIGAGLVAIGLGTEIVQSAAAHANEAASTAYKVCLVAKDLYTPTLVSTLVGTGVALAACTSIKNLSSKQAKVIALSAYMAVQFADFEILNYGNKGEHFMLPSIFEKTKNEITPTPITSKTSVPFASMSIG